VVGLALHITVGGLLHVIEFEKQMYMTKEQIRIEADKYNRSLSKHPMSVLELTEVLVGFYERLQLLQQTVCYTALGEVERLLSKELEKDGNGFETFKDLENNSDNQRCLRRVLLMIKERQANAV